MMRYMFQVRVRQQTILEEEMLKRQKLETIKAEQDRILAEERKVREGLEEVSKEQAKALEEVYYFHFCKNLTKRYYLL